ncbi:hypothetical protein ACJRO7_033758 [Eucalyptus globulus]|uniref:Uncharacterized protein n=1 Tax=Eucalyptus globulus TaxID=34317 RepID=A0ABD3J751_EUCGL
MARTVKDVSPHEFVNAYAAHLKRSGKIELPHWTDIVKTARSKFYIRIYGVDVDPRGGRRITSTDQRDLDQVAGRILVATVEEQRNMGILLKRSRKKP